MYCDKIQVTSKYVFVSSRIIFMSNTLVKQSLFHMVPYFFYFVTLKIDLLLKNFNLGCYLIIVAARQASLSSDNFYCVACEA